MTETVVLPAAQAITTDEHVASGAACCLSGGTLFSEDMNERIVCLDIGDVRIGVAVSDPTGTIASPVEVIQRVGWGPDTRRIVSICERYETNRILSGLPLNMDGSEGFQAGKVRDLCRQLTQAGLTVYFQDERLTTVTAEEALLEGSLSRKKRKTKVDKVAAALILEQWLKENKS